MNGNESGGHKMNNEPIKYFRVDKTVTSVVSGQTTVDQYCVAALSLDAAQDTTVKAMGIDVSYLALTETTVEEAQTCFAFRPFSHEKEYFNKSGARWLGSLNTADLRSDRNKMV